MWHAVYTYVYGTQYNASVHSMSNANGTGTESERVKMRTHNSVSLKIYSIWRYATHSLSPAHFSLSNTAARTHTHTYTDTQINEERKHIFSVLYMHVLHIKKRSKFTVWRNSCDQPTKQPTEKKTSSSWFDNFFFCISGSAIDSKRKLGRLYSSIVKKNSSVFMTFSLSSSLFPFYFFASLSLPRCVWRANYMNVLNNSNSICTLTWTLLSMSVVEFSISDMFISNGFSGTWDRCWNTTRKMKTTRFQITKSNWNRLLFRFFFLNERQFARWIDSDTRKRCTRILRSTSYFDVICWLVFLIAVPFSNSMRFVHFVLDEEKKTKLEFRKTHTEFELLYWCTQ